MSRSTAGKQLNGLSASWRNLTAGDAELRRGAVKYSLDSEYSALLRVLCGLYLKVLK